MKNSSHLCPVCGKFQFKEKNSYEICEICGWQDDIFQADNPDEDQCANIMSLNEARLAYKEGRKIE